jgi:hypothetical protein
LGGGDQEDCGWWFEASLGKKVCEILSQWKKTGLFFLNLLKQDSDLGLRLMIVPICGS